MQRGAVLLIVSALSGCGRFGFEADLPNDITPEPDPPVDGKLRVTIKHNNGDGTVVGPNGFTCLSGECTIDVEPGTALTFRPLAASGSWFAGWTGLCGGNFDCDIVVDTTLVIQADFTVTPNRMFVTSTTTTGAFGGIAGGDAICASRATAAGLTGTFIAYLSDSTTDAASRLSTSRGWVRTDGAPFVDAPTSFVTGEILFPARLDEYGTELDTDVRVFTGTDYGIKTAQLCTDWTSADGLVDGSVNDGRFAYDMLSSRTLGCDNQARLLCVETGRVQPVMTRPDTGKLAFATTNRWTPGGGRDSADLHCTAEATLAGISGTFRAAMATTTDTIASRFPADAIYRRLDGVRLLRGGDMWNADWYDVPPQLDQFGDIVSNDYWTGTRRFNALPQPADNCNNWTDNTDLLGGYQHWTTNSDLRDAFKTGGCSNAQPLLCLED